jgi:hypothetical protein
MPGALLRHWRIKGSYLGLQCRRIASRRGAKRALIAVAHTLLTIM